MPKYSTLGRHVRNVAGLALGSVAVVAVYVGFVIPVVRNQNAQLVLPRRHPVMSEVEVNYRSNNWSIWDAKRQQDEPFMGSDKRLAGRLIDWEDPLRSTNTMFASSPRVAAKIIAFLQTIDRPSLHTSVRRSDAVDQFITACKQWCIAMESGPDGLMPGTRVSSLSAEKYAHSARLFEKVLHQQTDHPEIAALAQLAIGLTKGHEDSQDTASIRELKRTVGHFGANRDCSFMATFYMGQVSLARSLRAAGYRRSSLRRKCMNTWNSMLSQYRDHDEWFVYHCAETTLNDWVRLLKWNEPQK